MMVWVEGYYRRSPQRQVEKVFVPIYLPYAVPVERRPTARDKAGWLSMRCRTPMRKKAGWLR